MADKKPEGKITKAEAVRRALRHLGKDAGRAEIQTYVKDELGIDMNLDHVSTARAEALRKMGAKKAKAKAAPKTEEAGKEAAPPAAKPAAKAAAKDGILLEDILKIKKLVETVGPAELRTLIEVMSK